jgi:hypothetical protein
MTGAFQDVLIFMIIEFAAKVCTFAGKRPIFVVTVEKDKIRGGQITGSRYRFIYVYIGWLFGNFEAGKL